jgi:hypothetical protein
VVAQALRSFGSGLTRLCRCGSGENMFHVETTAWEGEHAWKPKGVNTTAKSSILEGGESKSRNEAAFANYGSYFWSEK